MAKKRITAAMDVNMSGNKIENVDRISLRNRSGIPDPADAPDGTIIFDSLNKTIKIYTDGSWKLIAKEDDYSHLTDAMLKLFGINEALLPSGKLTIDFQDNAVRLGFNKQGGGYEMLSSVGISNFITALSNNSQYLAPTQKSVNDALVLKADKTALALKADTQAVNQALATKQATLVSGTNIKTIDGKSILGSGNLEISNIFVAVYGETTVQEIIDAYNDGRFIKGQKDNREAYLTFVALNAPIFYFTFESAEERIIEDWFVGRTGWETIEQSFISAASIANNVTTTYEGEVLDARQGKVLDDKITAERNRIDDVEDLVPAQASSVNKLADKAFVNSTIQTATADFRGNWYDWDSVPVDASEYPEDYKGSHIPTNKDYMVVQNAELYGFSADIERSWIVGEICRGRMGGDDRAMYRCVNDFDGRASDNPDYFDRLFYLEEYRGNYFEEDEWNAGNICSYNDQFYECGQSVETTIENTPDKDTEHWALIDTNYYNIRFGTWRFKYSGLWAEMGKDGWLPEYQVNETPLTAAQVAALNSNITAELTASIPNKLSKPSTAGTAGQVLTCDGQGGQTWANAAGGKFEVEYGVTQYSEITTAVAAGKMCVCHYLDRTFYLGNMQNGYYFFFCMELASNRWLRLSATNAWIDSVTTMEQSQYKATSLANPDNTHYPTTGAVANALEGKADATEEATTQPAGGFLPNTLYKLGTLTGAVTFALAAAIAGQYSEYMIDFIADTPAPTITWPAGISWMGGSAPTITAGKHYQVSILNNLAISAEF